MASKKNLHPLLTAIFTICLSVPAANAAILSLGSSTSSVTVGSGFDVHLSISNLSGTAGDSLSAFDVDLLYDPSVFKLTSFRFIDPASGINQLDLPEVDALPFDGNVFDLGGVLDAYGISGNSDAELDAAQADAFTSLSVHFLALANPGSSHIRLDLQDPNLLLLDSQFGDLSLEYANADVQINVINRNSGNVPEPATLALSALGISLMGLARRR